MKLALSLAAKGAGWVSPNPMVGAVAGQRRAGGGRGYHRRAGAPHAEVEALARRRGGGPGRGPVRHLRALQPPRQDAPCTQAILAAGCAG